MSNKSIFNFNKNIGLILLLLTSNIYAANRNNKININKNKISIKRNELLEKNIYYIHNNKISIKQINEQIQLNIIYLNKTKIDNTLLEHITLLYEKLYLLTKKQRYLTKSFLINKKLFNITNNKKYFINKLRILQNKKNYHKLYNLANNYLKNNYNNIITNYYLNSIILSNYKFKLNPNIKFNLKDEKIQTKLQLIKENKILKNIRLKDNNVFT